MELPVIYVFTHDSIGLGEDGQLISPSNNSPTCVHARSCRAPARGRKRGEGGWKIILQFTRAGGPGVVSSIGAKSTREIRPASGLAAGRTFSDTPGADPKSPHRHREEVSLCLQAYEQLTKEGVRNGWSACVVGVL